MNDYKTTTNWYSVQVTPGTEAAAAQTLREAIARAGVCAFECFAPRYRTMRKVAGELRECESALIPGCIVVVCDEERAVRNVVRRSGVAASARFAVERMDAQLVDWIAGCTTSGSRVVDASAGVVRGESVRVTAGPLVAREGWIRRVNQRKKCAYLDIPAGGKRIQAETGLRLARA